MLDETPVDMVPGFLPTLQSGGYEGTGTVGSEFPEFHFLSFKYHYLLP